MTQEQFDKLNVMMRDRKCPICGRYNIMQCIQHKTSLYYDKDKGVIEENPGILNDDYLTLECPYCSYIMNFHIKNLKL